MILFSGSISMLSSLIVFLSRLFLNTSWIKALLEIASLFDLSLESLKLFFVLYSRNLNLKYILSVIVFVSDASSSTYSYESGKLSSLHVSLLNVSLALLTLIIGQVLLLILLGAINLKLIFSEMLIIIYSSSSSSLP